MPGEFRQNSGRCGINVKWLKKWSFLILLVGVGVVYLSEVDHWQVYAESLDQTKVFWQKIFYGEQVLSGSVVASPETNDTTEWISADGNDDDHDSGASGEQNGEDRNDKDKNGQSSDEEDQSGFGEEDTLAQDDEENHITEDGFWDGSDPVYMTVEDDYFADAVFIGDSRTVGMYEYGDLEEVATFYASKGLTIYKLFDANIVEIPGQQQKLTVEEALLNNEFKKIYLMVGINEMGTGTVETFTAKYKEAVDHLLELQPNAILYIQGILKVTTERSNKGDYIHNEGIVARNEALAQLADNRRIFYLDVNPYICDETGGLVASYTFDGVHLKAKYVEIWKNYLKEHAIDLGGE